MGASARDDRVGAALVAAQFALIALCLLPVGPTVTPSVRGLGVALLLLALLVGGLALLAMGVHTRVHPVPGDRTPLRTNGIYAWIRHPMYTSVLLACAGVTASTGRVLSWVAVLALVVVLGGKARFEDRMLRTRFGAPFDRYAARVPAFLPAPWRSGAR